MEFILIVELRSNIPYEGTKPTAPVAVGTDQRDFFAEKESISIKLNKYAKCFNK
ncbi:hypothetical protein [Flavobacterium sp. XS2P39]|uniref:hypothetical protein n=1 Tax=Flavobacterium sp. XS2P39 TaxID=3401725 RepID=UPI003AAFF55D